MLSLPVILRLPRPPILARTTDHLPCTSQATNNGENLLCPLYKNASLYRAELDSPAEVARPVGFGRSGAQAAVETGTHVRRGTLALKADGMHRCRGLGQFGTRWPTPLLQPHTPGRTYSEYAPAAPSPSDLKGPLPEKFSVGKNLKLKVCLTGVLRRTRAAGVSVVIDSRIGTTPCTAITANGSSRRTPLP